MAAAGHVASWRHAVSIAGTAPLPRQTHHRRPILVASRQQRHTATTPKRDGIDGGSGSDGGSTSRWMCKQPKRREVACGNDGKRQPRQQEHPQWRHTSAATAGAAAVVAAAARPPERRSRRGSTDDTVEVTTQAGARRRLPPGSLRDPHVGPALPAAAANGPAPPCGNQTRGTRLNDWAVVATSHPAETTRRGQQPETRPLRHRGGTSPQAQVRPPPVGGRRPW